MAGEKKSPGADIAGIVFKNPTPKKDASAESPVAELYERSLASISQPGKKDVRIFSIENAFAGKSIEEGTIVSDRRKDRPTLFENIADAFAEWRSKVSLNIAGDKKTRAETEAPRRISREPAMRTKEKSMSPRDGVIHDQHSASEKPQLQKMRTMKRDASVNVEIAEVPRTGTEVAQRKESDSSLQKVRTFKSDAAHVRKPDAGQIKEQIVPVTEAAPESKPVAADTAKATLLKKAARVMATDVRSEMIAPVVDARLDAEIHEFAPKKKIAAKPETQRTYGIHIPDTITAPRAPVVEPPQKKFEQKEATPAPAAEPPQWKYTHTGSEAATENIQETSAPLSQRSIQQSIDQEAALRETAIPILANEVRTIDHVTSEAREEKLPLESTKPPAQESPVPTEETPVKQVGAQAESERFGPVAAARTVEASGLDSPFHGGHTQSMEPADTPPRVAPPTAAHGQHASHGHSALIRFALRMVLALVVAGGLIVLAAYLLSTKETTPTGEPQNVTEPNAPPSSQEAHTLILAGDPHMFLTDLAQAVALAPAGFTQFSITKGSENVRATTQEFLAHINAHVPARSARALEERLMIGSITTTHNEPFIVLSSNNFDALFAGLLAWESTMHDELAPLFGEARNSTALFTDAVRDNRSIRILRDEEENEILLYSFVNDRTVIMTTSAEALAKLIGHF